MKTTGSKCNGNTVQRGEISENRQLKSEGVTGTIQIKIRSESEAAISSTTTPAIANNHPIPPDNAETATTAVPKVKGRSVKTNSKNATDISYIHCAGNINSEKNNDPTITLAFV